MTFDLALLPLWLLQLIAFGFGVIIGSFLNVYIYRFHTGKSLAGRSHCLSCGTGLRWYELFPLFSYLALRGRCRTCGCHITARYFWVELLTGVLFALALTVSLDIVTILLLWFILAVLVVITVYDLYHFIIPDKLTATLTIAVIVLSIYQLGFSEGMWERWWWGPFTALVGSSFFYLLWKVSAGKWLGFGDVKLAFPLGLLVGPVQVFSFVVLSFWIGAAVSLTLLAVAHTTRGKAHLHLPGKVLTMKSEVPFAPFLIASCIITLLTEFNVLTLFSFM
jgi:leader peptidase (prepilin peptidase)/N-methyltransferase